MKKLFVAGIFMAFSIATPAQNITTRFEQSKGTQTPTYFEIIDWWKKLDEKSGKVKMLTMGMSDAGYPLYYLWITDIMMAIFLCSNDLPLMNRYNTHLNN